MLFAEKKLKSKAPSACAAHLDKGRSLVVKYLKKGGFAMQKKQKNELKKAFDAVRLRPREIFFYNCIDSTNEQARRYPEGVSSDERLTLDGRDGTSLFIADSQTHGRGRLDRRFVSNAGAGLYMSIRFPFSGELADAVGITPFASVAVCRAIESLSDAKPKIKWVNDVYLGGKKLAGILTESIVGSDGKRYFICGIGINLVPSEMPSELAMIATNLESEGFFAPREHLAAKICEEFLLGVEGAMKREILDEYRSRSFIIGSTVSVHGADGIYNARVLGIGDRYELVVSDECGKEKRLSSGEVSLKLQPNVSQPDSAG